jgi:hypothetical protein
VILLLGAALSVGFSDLVPRAPALKNSRVLHGLLGLCFVAWLALVIVVCVVHARQEDRLRQLYWGSEHKSVSLRDVFWPRLRFLIVAGVIFPVLVVVVDLATSHRGLPPPAVHVAMMALPMVICFWIATLVLYNREQDRIAEVAYLHFAEDLGVSPVTLRKITEDPEFHRKTFAGVWAKATIDHKGNPVHFAAEQSGPPGGYGRFPLLVLSVDRPEEVECSGRRFLQGLDRQSRESFVRIRRIVPRAKMSCCEGRVFLMMPVVNTDITVDLLRDAMDILVRIPSDDGIGHCYARE